MVAQSSKPRQPGCTALHRTDKHSRWSLNSCRCFRQIRAFIQVLQTRFQKLKLKVCRLWGSDEARPVTAQYVCHVHWELRKNHSLLCESGLQRRERSSIRRPVGEIPSDREGVTVDDIASDTLTCSLCGGETQRPSRPAAHRSERSSHCNTTQAAS